LVQPLPLPDPFDPRDDWKIAVEIPNGPGLNPPEGVPFDLHIMTDDAGIKSDLSVVPGDYKPGDKIKLRAKLAQFGRPILGLGSHPGDRIEAELVKPGKSVGDILSDSTASADPSGPDPQSRAGAKLTNTLNQDPSVLVHQSDTVQLFDDGNPAHGDDVAGDGIYSALYPATLPGHYNFLFAVESTAPDAVRFSRQQIRTAYVRPFADRGNTTFQTSIQPCAPTALTPQGCKTLTILMAPRTKAHDRMGPGWGSYFWFVTPGQAPVKAVDSPRLDGTYTAVIDFNGAIPPKVSVHFINVIALIDDSATVGQLPQQLDANNLLAEITASGASRVAAFLDFGAAVPHPGFANVANTGFSLNAGLEYVWTSNVSTEGIFGYHHFSVVGPVIVNVGGNCGPQFGIPCPVTPGPRIGLNVYQFSANAKVYLRPPPKKLRPFVNGGPGSYKFSPGSWSVGGNVGAGTLYEVTPRFGVQGSYNFHAVNTSGGATTFSTLQGGIRVVF
jgi:hypothetical protein